MVTRFQRTGLLQSGIWDPCVVVLCVFFLIQWWQSGRAQLCEYSRKSKMGVGYVEKEMIFFCVCSMSSNSSATVVMNKCRGRAGAIPAESSTNRAAPREGQAWSCMWPQCRLGAHRWGPRRLRAGPSWGKLEGLSTIQGSSAKAK